VLGVLAILSFSMVLIPAAQAASSSFTWTGHEKAPNWSTAENWEGGAAPSSSEPVKLVFPWLSVFECGLAKPAEACYLSLDDVPDLTAESIEIDDASLQIGGDGEQAGKLAASSVTLDRDTSVGFEIRGTAPTPGVDYGEIVAHGPVNLADAFLAIYVPEPCEAPPVGQVYTLLETSGELTGSFGGAFEGAEIPVEFFKECGSQSPVKVKIEYHRGGAVKTVTATVLAPPRVGIPASAPAATPTPAIVQPPGKGSVSLADTGVTVQGAGVVLVKLECRGSETCSGKLTLSAKIPATSKRAAKGEKRRSWATTTSTIGSASFSVAGDEAKTLQVKLDAAARAALSSDHGRLSASLAILELAPNPANIQTATVQLAQQKTRAKAHGKRKK